MNTAGVLLRSIRFLPVLLIFLPLVLCTALTAQTIAANEARGIVYLTGAHKAGTAICLDTPCSHLLTNYHLAAFFRPGMKVEGVRIADIRSATSAADQQARPIHGLGRTFMLRLNPERDLALLTLVRPLAARFRGMSFASYRPRVGQKVVRIAYQRKRLDINKGEILAAQVALSLPDDPQFKPTSTLLVNTPSAAGNSGGAVCDEQGNVVGIVYGAQVVAPDGTLNFTSGGEVPVATLALPVSAISDFLRGQEPALWATVFPTRPDASDLEPITDAERLEHRPQLMARAGNTNTRLQLDAPPVLNAGIDRDAAIMRLQAKTQINLARIANLFAEQEIQLWGEDQSPQLWRHEVAVHDGRQKYRAISANGRRGKLLDDLPLPPAKAVRPGGEWYHLLNDLSRARLRYAGTTSVRGAPVHMFEFSASAADKLCYWQEAKRGPLATSQWFDAVDCTGHVVADADFNTLEIGEQLYPPMDRITWLVDVNVAYALTQLQQESAPTLLPESIRMAVQFADGEWHFASGVWKNYHRFSAQATILPGYAEVESAANLSPHPRP